MAKGTISRTTFAKGLAAGVIVAGSLGLLQNLEYSPVQKADSGLTFTPGTYTSVGKGIAGDVTVTCTFDESSITAIEADVSGETPGIGADIEEEMVNKLLTAQTSDVDGVANATITSDAIKAAVADCIAQATGQATSQADGQVEGQAPSNGAASSPETEADADADETEIVETEITTELSTEAVVTEITTEADEVTTEAEETAAAEAKFTPGTYTASAKGIGTEKDITVTCTFDETSITEMEADVSGETPGLGADIADEMISKFLEAQSSDVDGIANVTITSDALKAAVADCIAQASSASASTAAETEAPETEVPATEASETEVPATEVSETEAPATEAPETEVPATEASETEAPAVKYQPGTYTAVAKGNNGKITVLMVCSENEITKIKLDVAVETPELGGAVPAVIIPAILEAQSTEVDNITGATVTTDAVKAALNECIANAAIEVVDAAEAPADAEAAALYIPGTYTAAAPGVHGDVTVEMVFDENSIISVLADVEKEDANLGGVAGPLVASAIVENQTIEVDGKSGATVTSDAVKAAAAECIAQATAK